MVSLWSSRGRIVLGLVGLVLVCLPVVGARVLISGHAQEQAREDVEQVAAQFVARADEAIESSSSLLTQLALRGIATCAPEHLDQLVRSVYNNVWLKEIIVRGPDGKPLCNQLGDSTPIKALSPEYPTARPDIRLQVVELRASGRRGIMLLSAARPLGGLAAVVPSEAITAGLLPTQLADTASGTVTFTDGTVVGRFSHAGRVDDEGHLGATVVGKATSVRYPIAISIGAPLGAYKAQQSSMLTYSTIGGGLISTLIFALLVYVLRGPPVEIARLNDALARDEFVPYYQPIIDIGTSRLAGCEVLMRWRKPDGTIVAPDQFIRLAETSRLAWPMTLALMHRVRDDLDEAFGARPQLKISINLFNAHFSTLRTVQDVESIFGRSRISPRQLVFELTERQPLGDVRRARVVIRRLQALGARVALDDAGTGHSGLAYLHQLGVDVVKIDKLFVDTIDNGGATPIVDSLIKLGHDLKMEVVAEGVESFAQLDYLREHGADSAQGYLFSPPLPAKAFIDLVGAMEPHRDASRSGRGEVIAFAPRVA